MPFEWLGAVRSDRVRPRDGEDAMIRRRITGPVRVLSIDHAIGVDGRYWR